MTISVTVPECFHYKVRLLNIRIRTPEALGFLILIFPSSFAADQKPAYSKAAFHTLKHRGILEKKPRSSSSPSILDPRSYEATKNGGCFSGVLYPYSLYSRSHVWGFDRCPTWGQALSASGKGLMHQASDLRPKHIRSMVHATHTFDIHPADKTLDLRNSKTIPCSSNI
ncbi:hypothetical protein CC2G_009732 [Coprinopsis cinerea AmutBmut pab1-1]|nr:hypothetical protein CC2G_009732 [Coprinopsis cinerea AmutBmut pab1-1]